MCCTDHTCTSTLSRDLSGELSFAHEALNAAIPTRKLSASERDAYETRGAVLLHGLVPNREFVQELAHNMWRHGEAFAFGEYISTTWEYNPGARALVMARGLSALMRDVLGSPGVAVLEAPIWGKRGTQPQVASRPYEWHADQSRAEAMRPRSRSRFVTVWIALSEAPGALEFATQTNSRSASLEGHARCNTSAVSGAAGTRVLDDECLVRWQASRGLGPEAFFRPDLRPGDALLFNGHTLHRGIMRKLPRLGVSLRYEPTRTRGTFACMHSAGNAAVVPVEKLAHAPWTNYARARSSCVRKMLTSAGATHLLLESKRGNPEHTAEQAAEEVTFAHQACRICSWSALFRCDTARPRLWL